MSKNFLKEAMLLVAGKPAEEIADILNGKKYTNEFLIAKKLNLTINQTRNILYKLSDFSLVSSIRKKDRKKGWYTYFWKIEVLKSLEFVRGNLVRGIEQTESQIKSKETKEFYLCKRCNIEFNQENALLHNFTCDDCGEIFVLNDNSKNLRDLRKTLSRICAELKVLDGEIESENSRIGKEKVKEMKKTEALKKDKKSQKSRTLRENAEKKTGKKKSLQKKALISKKGSKKSTEKLSKKSKKPTAKKKVLGKKRKK